jgi:hypothetical protein
MRLFRTIFEFIEVWFKFRLLIGAKRFIVSGLSVNRISNEDYFRVSCQFTDIESGKSSYAMAEGKNYRIAKLRCVAEAYERLCVDLYFGAIEIDRRFPYGLGVGLRSSSALRRAFGEYFERCIAYTSDQNHKFDHLYGDRFETPYGPAYVCIVRDNEKLIGSGYGFSTGEARESALRSKLRKMSVPQNPIKFQVPDHTPIEYLITPKVNAWLECGFVGFIKQQHRSNDKIS